MLPDESRQIKHDSLNEEEEDDPLVIFVIGQTLARAWGSDTGVRLLDSLKIANIYKFMCNIQILNNEIYLFVTVTCPVAIYVT